MNKVILTALIAGGLLLLDSPEAAAHKEVRNMYAPSAYYRVEHRRAKHMPYWLKRNKSFRHWYARTHLRKRRHLAWHQLYEIFRRERAYARHYRHRDNYYRDNYYRDNYYRDFDDYRDHDRRGKGKRRHDH